MPAAVLLPASFIALGAEWLLFAIADRLDAAAVDSQRYQDVLHGAGALITQGQVVVGRSALIAVPFDGDVDVGVLPKELRVRLHGGLLIGTDIRLVVVEVHVPDVLVEQVFFADRGSRRRRWRRRLRYRQACRGFLGSTCPFRGQMIRRRIGWRDALRAVGLHRADSIDGNIGGVAGLPRQRSRLPGLNRAGTYGNRGRGSRRRRRRW